MVNRLVTRRLPRLLAAVLALSACVAQARGAADAAGVTYFENTIRPLLVARCYECHSSGAKKVKGELLLDSKAGWSHGGLSGPAVVPGNPDQSPLIKAVRYDHEPKMPPKGKLSQAEIDALVRWVERGAPDPREGPAVAPPPARKGIDLEEGRKLWSLQPLTRPAPPAVKDAARAPSPIDRFVVAKLEAKAVAPNPPVDRRKLIRRAYFDLHGLPPTPQEVEAFDNDPSPDAWGKLIDRLLADSRYGERWGRHWLDVVRYA